MREFRRNHPWLRRNLQNSDRFNKLSDGQSLIFYGVRANPDNPSEKIAMVTHLSGEPIEVALGDLLQLDLNEWQIVQTTPGIEIENLDRFTLNIGQGVLAQQCDPITGCTIEPSIGAIPFDTSDVLSYTTNSTGTFCDTDRTDANADGTLQNPVADVTAIVEEAEPEPKKSKIGKKAAKGKAKSKAKGKGQAKAKSKAKTKTKPKSKGDGKS